MHHIEIIEQSIMQKSCGKRVKCIDDKKRNEEREGTEPATVTRVHLLGYRSAISRDKKKKKIPGAKYKVRVITLNASILPDTPVRPLPSRITARVHR